MIHTVTFEVKFGMFGVDRLAAGLNTLVRDGRIADWHPGRWTDWRHTALDIGFDTAHDAAIAKADCLDAATC